MNYRPKVVRCRLKTGGKSIPQIREECRGQGLTYRDFENMPIKDFNRITNAARSFLIDTGY